LLPVHRGFWWTCVVALLVILFVASSQASYIPPALFSWQDKVQHFTFFAAWGFCFHQALCLSNWKLGVLATVLFCALNGALDEWHQTFTPGRSGNDVFDWVADVAGGCFAAALGTLVMRRSPSFP
jgi:VanZ family protein